MRANAVSRAGRLRRGAARRGPPGPGGSGRLDLGALRAARRGVRIARAARARPRAANGRARGRTRRGRRRVLAGARFEGERGRVHPALLRDRPAARRAVVAARRGVAPRTVASRRCCSTRSQRSARARRRLGRHRRRDRPARARRVLRPGRAATRRADRAHHLAAGAAATRSSGSARWSRSRGIGALAAAWRRRSPLLDSARARARLSRDRGARRGATRRGRGSLSAAARLRRGVARRRRRRRAPGARASDRLRRDRRRRARRSRSRPRCTCAATPTTSALERRDREESALGARGAESRRGASRPRRAARRARVARSRRRARAGRSAGRARIAPSRSSRWAIRSEARARLDAIVDANPTFWPATLRAGHLALDAHDWDAAAERYEAVLRVHPLSAEAWAGLGVVREREGRRDDARRALERSLVARPRPGQRAGVARDAREARVVSAPGPVRDGAPRERIGWILLVGLAVAVYSHFYDRYQLPPRFPGSFGLIVGGDVLPLLRRPGALRRASCCANRSAATACAGRARVAAARTRRRLGRRSSRSCSGSRRDPSSAPSIPRPRFRPRASTCDRPRVPLAAASRAAALRHRVLLPRLPALPARRARSASCARSSIQTAPYVLPARRKPPLEVAQALWAGVVFALVAWRTGSFLPAFVAHWAVAITMDWLCFRALHP